MKVKNESEVAQSCPTLCNPMDCSLPGSSAHGIFQARVLEWVAIAFSTCIYDVCLISVQLLSEILFWKKNFCFINLKAIALRNPKVRFVPISYAFLFFFYSSFLQKLCLLLSLFGFPGGTVVKNSPANAGEVGLIPGLGRSPGEVHGNPLQYSCLQNSMDRGAWQATVHGVTKSWTGLSMHAHCYYHHYCLFLILSDRKLKNHIIQYLTLDKPFWSPLWWEGLRDRS